MYALKYGNIELISFLIQKGADVNRRCPGANFPLYIAIKKKRGVAVIDLLLSNGAEINAKAFGGTIALTEACTTHCEWGNYEDVINFLIQKGANVSNVGQFGDETPFYVMMLRGAEDYDDKTVASGINIFVREIAKLRSFNKTFVYKLDIDLIKKYPKVQKYYQLCNQELAKMANTNLYGSYSYFSVLRMSKNIKQLAYLLKNEEFLKKFNKNLFPLYKDDLQWLFDEAIKLRDQILLQ